MADFTYFAFGEREPEVMEAIIGRMPEVEPALLPDYELCVQLAAHMPAKVQAILGEQRTPQEMQRFSAFVAHPSKGSRMSGWVTKVSSQELALLDNWDIDGLWMDRHDNRLVKVGTSLEERRTSLHVVTANKVRSARSVFGEGMIPTFLNDVERTKEIATAARLLFLAEQEQ